jgi:hypothetical protein
VIQTVVYFSKSSISLKWFGAVEVIPKLKSYLD